MAILSKQKMGIDLGTSTTLIFLYNKGIALREPSIVAVNQETNEAVAFGKEAKNLYGKTSEKFKLVYPIKEGVISHYALATQMLTYFIKKALHRKNISPEVVISVSSYISKVERKAVVDMVKDIGIRKALIVEEPFAAAVGSGLNISDAKGHFIVDIGGGTTDIALISYGEVIEVKTTNFAGIAMTHAIQDMLYEDFQLRIPYTSAENIKKKLGYAYFASNDIDDSMLVSGQHIVKDIPEQVTLKASQVHKALDSVIKRIVYTCRQVLAETSPELIVDLMEEGIYLTGRGGR